MATKKISVHRLRIALKNDCVRVIDVPSEMSMYELHLVIAKAFGWQEKLDHAFHVYHKISPLKYASLARWETVDEGETKKKQGPTRVHELKKGRFESRTAVFVENTHQQDEGVKANVQAFRRDFGQLAIVFDERAYRVSGAVVEDTSVFGGTKSDPPVLCYDYDCRADKPWRHEIHIESVRKVPFELDATGRWSIPCVVEGKNDGYQESGQAIRRIPFKKDAINDELAKMYGHGAKDTVTRQRTWGPSPIDNFAFFKCYMCVRTGQKGDTCEGDPKGFAYCLKHEQFRVVDRLEASAALALYNAKRRRLVRARRRFLAAQDPSYVAPKDEDGIAGSGSGDESDGWGDEPAPEKKK